MSQTRTPRPEQTPATSASGPVAGKPRRRLALLAGTALVAALVLAAVVGRQAGEWVIVEDPVPPRLDVLLTFDGEGARVRYAEELLRDHPGALWILGEDELEHLTGVESSLRSRHELVLTSLTSTRDEVCLLRDLLAERFGTASETLDVGLVSGPYHMRRIATLAQRLLERPEGGLPPHRLHYLPVPPDRYGRGARDYHHWWRERVLRRLVPQEIQKTVGEVVRGIECPAEES